MGKNISMGDGTGAQEGAEDVTMGARVCYMLTRFVGNKPLK